jgi:CHAD domain-containing protein
MREREAKLLADPAVELPEPDTLLAGIGQWAQEEIHQDADYYDTSDLRLTRAGVSLRHRSDDGWTVKLPESRSGATLVRQEHAFAGVHSAPPPAAVDLVTAWTRSRPLEKVARIRTHRRKLHVRNEHGDRIGEIDDDDVTATVLRQPQVRFREIEVEVDEGADPGLVETVVKRLRRVGIGEGTSMPKIARALGDAALAPPDLVPPDEINRASTLGDLVRASISGSVRQLVDHDPVIRASEEPEGIHKARVATRRLRSDLKTFRPVLDRKWSEPLRSELRWLGEELGRVRDADVLLGLLEAKAQKLPDSRQGDAGALLDRLREMRDRDRELLLHALRSDRYTKLLDQLVEAANAPRLRPGMAHRRGSKSVGTLVRKPWKRLVKRVKRLPSSPPDTELHTIRKRAKQARYALEAVTPVMGRAAAKAANRLAHLQDVLGEHQDAVVAVEWLSAAAKDSNGTAIPFAAGELAGSFEADRRELQKAWTKAWKRARSQGLPGAAS